MRLRLAADIGAAAVAIVLLSTSPNAVSFAVSFVSLIGIDIQLRAIARMIRGERP